MLRTFFPSSTPAAALYGGFMREPNVFCKSFSLGNGLPATLRNINTFLAGNGYDSLPDDVFQECFDFQVGPVIVIMSDDRKEVLLCLQRDSKAASQMAFLTAELLKFRDARDWEQFHNPKDLAIALSIEAGELLEQFLWKKPEDASIDKIKEELADVFAFGLLLAEKLGLDPEEIILEKIQRNGEKYPVDRARGRATKYNEL